ncbi:MAG: glypican [Cyanobacteriota bacterium]|jgi:hypothetical protein
MSLLLASAAVGVIVLTGLAALTLIPLLLILGGLALWIVVTLLLAWAGLEALAACERWMERQPRFQR